MPGTHDRGALIAGALGTMHAMSAAPNPPSPHTPSPRAALQLVLATAAVVALVILLVRPTPSPGVEVERRAPSPGIDEIRVDVRGAVRSPGVVIARPGQRVEDVIAAAGGALPDADLAAMNLARRVLDQDDVVVPRAGESAAALLDLNRATQRQLEALPGIGVARATAIIAARQRAPFISTDELVERGLIPPSVYAGLRDLVATPRP